MITIVDYGMGNLAAVHNMLAKVGVTAQVSADPEVIVQAEKLILPGVGAFDAAIANIHKRGLWQVLDRKAMADRVPILGICLGMQLMTRSSEEGQAKGFGWIEADTARFKFERGVERLPIPHMGWNTVRPTRSHALIGDPAQEYRFYFVHSYYVRCDRPEDVLGVTDYGGEFVSGFEHGNVIGFQFHPEKSHRFGMQLLKRFGEA